MAKNGRVIPLAGADAAATGRYYVRFTNGEGKRKVVPAGATLAEAITAMHRVGVNLASGEAASELLADFKANASGRVSLRDAADRWFAELKTLDKRPGTISAYTRAVEQFIISCKKTFVDELGREDLVAYISWLRENLTSNGRGESNSTIATRLTHLDIWLNTLGKGQMLPAKARPRFTKKTADRYSVETVNALLNAADADDKFLIQFFLYTGGRALEVAHAEWNDIHDGAFHLKSKPHWNWTIKDREEREIPLPAAFVEEAMLRKAKTNCGLMFPASSCKPDKHLERRIQSVAKKAGLQGQFSCHKFRRTYASILIQKFSLPTVQKLLGHSNVATTQKYLAAESVKTDEAKSRIEEAFASVS